MTEQQQQQQDIRRLTDVENRIVVAKGEEAKGGVDWEAGVSGCKLLYTGWINSRSYCRAQALAPHERLPELPLVPRQKPGTSAAV